MQDVKIEIANVVTLTFCGENTKELKSIYSKAKKAAESYGGKILRDEELKDGYFLEVFFNNKKDEKQWKNCIGLQ